jgi:hypothetical protein
VLHDPSFFSSLSFSIHFFYFFLYCVVPLCIDIYTYIYTYIFPPSFYFVKTHIIMRVSTATVLFVVVVCVLGCTISTVDAMAPSAAHRRGADAAKLSPATESQTTPPAGATTTPPAGGRTSPKNPLYNIIRKTASTTIKGMTEAAGHLASAAGRVADAVQGLLKDTEPEKCCSTPAKREPIKKLMPKPDAPAAAKQSAIAKLTELVGDKVSTLMEKVGSKHPAAQGKPKPRAKTVAKSNSILDLPAELFTKAKEARKHGGAKVDGARDGVNIGTNVGTAAQKVTLPQNVLDSVLKFAREKAIQMINGTPVGYAKGAPDVTAAMGDTEKKINEMANPAGASGRPAGTPAPKAPAHTPVAAAFAEVEEHTGGSVLCSWFKSSADSPRLSPASASVPFWNQDTSHSGKKYKIFGAGPMFQLGGKRTGTFNCASCWYDTSISETVTTSYSSSYVFMCFNTNTGLEVSAPESCKPRGWAHIQVEGSASHKSETGLGCFGATSLDVLSVVHAEATAGGAKVINKALQVNSGIDEKTTIEFGASAGASASAADGPAGEVGVSFGISKEIVDTTTGGATRERPFSAVSTPQSSKFEKDVIDIQLTVSGHIAVKGDCRAWGTAWANNKAFGVAFRGMSECGGVINRQYDYFYHGYDGAEWDRVKNGVDAFVAPFIRGTPVTAPPARNS